MFLCGDGHQNIALTVHKHVVAVLPRSEAVKAHAIHVALPYIFGIGMFFCCKFYFHFGDMFWEIGKEQHPFAFQMYFPVFPMVIAIFFRGVFFTFQRFSEVSSSSKKSRPQNDQRRV